MQHNELLSVLAQILFPGNSRQPSMFKKASNLQSHCDCTQHACIFVAAFAAVAAVISKSSLAPQTMHNPMTDSNGNGSAANINGNINNIAFRIFISLAVFLLWHSCMWHWWFKPSFFFQPIIIFTTRAELGRKI